MIGRGTFKMRERFCNFQKLIIFEKMVINNIAWKKDWKNCLIIRHLQLKN